MKWLVDEAYPEADTVRVVLDNLNTHRGLYVAFVPDEARRTPDVCGHYTPKHGLAQHGDELSVFGRGGSELDETGLSPRSSSTFPECVFVFVDWY